MQENEINEEIVTSSEDVMEADPRVYEVGYLLVPSLKEEEVPAIYGNLKDLIANLGGQAVSDEMPTLINLAYSMQKVIENVHHNYDTAYFGWVKFVMDPEKVLELKKKLDLDTNIIRFLILKTVKENTIAGKRLGGREIPRRRAPAPGVGADTEPKAEAPINKEEIDKEIDAMVAN